MDAKSPILPQKAPKTGQKPAKNCQKVPIRACPSYHSGPAQRKTALALSPGPVASKKSPKNLPKNFLQKVIHNRRLT